MISHSQQYLFTVLFVVAALCVLLSHSSPVPSEEVPASSRRQGRFYGFGGSNAMAFASANARGGGYGFPGFGGYGGSTAMASASASAGGGGFGMYGK